MTVKITTHKVERTTAFDFLKDFPFLPIVLMRGKGRSLYGRPSNSELKRWLNNGSVKINGKIITSVFEEINYPITQLIFFPKNDKTRTTIWDKI